MEQNEREFTMIDFIFRLTNVMPHWAMGSELTLGEIAEATETSVPRVLQYLTEGLSRDIDVVGTISTEDTSKALHLLTKKMQPQIEARERLINARREKAAKAYDRMMDKVRIFLSEQNLYSAYKTITYFAGQYSENLPKEIFITACSDAVRIGIKAETNIQELGLWLQKAVANAMSFETREGMEEALDLVDAYGEYFLSEDTGKGVLLLNNILAALEEPAARYELWEQYKALVGQLYPLT